MSWQHSLSLFLEIFKQFESLIEQRVSLFLCIWEISRSCYKNFESFFVKTDTYVKSDTRYSNFTKRFSWKIQITKNIKVPKKKKVILLTFRCFQANAENT